MTAPTPVCADDVVIRLSPGVSFSTDENGRPGARITRGQSTTRFAIDRNIQTFLECFRTPLTLLQAAELLEKEGFARDNVLTFGKSLLKTPLLEFHDVNLPIPEAATILAAAGLSLVTAFKDRKFDGVYQASDSSGAARVVKLLRAPVGMAASARVLERMQNEHAVLMRLASVHAVVGAGNFVHAPHPYFEIEYIDGKTLTELVMRPCTFERRLRIATDAVGAMAAVHKLGVIHGDLHTSNFLIDAQGALRLIDFDCSFVADGNYVPRIGGAVHFMPPERSGADWHDNTEVAPDFASDIYQLGIILYFALSGLPPFRGKQYAELAAAIATGDYPPLERTAEAEPIAPAICAAVRACMAFRPDQRPASLEQLLPIFQASLTQEAQQ
jgi:serine/threonine protein kinase